MADGKLSAELAPDISEPKEDKDAHVFVPMLSMPKGFLCHVHGTATFPSNAYADKNIYMQLVEDKLASTPSAQDVVNAVNSHPGKPDNLYKKLPLPSAIPGTAYAWKCDSHFNAWCSQTSKTKYNTLLSVTASTTLDPATGGLAVSLEGPTAIHFYGLAKTTPCSIDAMATTDSAKSLATTAIPSIGDDEPKVYPTDHDGEWLLYSGIDVGTLDMGPTLMVDDGEPLVARLLAVSAKRVRWWHGAPHSLTQIVSRAAGELRIRDVSSGMPQYLFPDVSHSGIVLNQFASSGFTVAALSSECREHPDIFSFDPNYPIRTQVNFNRSEVRSGNYDLWVKVIQR